LYDVQKDPGQMNNLANDSAFAPVRQKLFENLVTYLHKTGDPRIEGKDPWKDYIYHQADGYGSVFNKSLPNHARERAKLRPSDHPDQKPVK
jgi:hypothetical protein